MTQCRLRSIHERSLGRKGGLETASIIPSDRVLEHPRRPRRLSRQKPPCGFLRPLHAFRDMATHSEYRTGRRAHDVFGHASEHQVRHAMPAVRAENNEIDRAVGRRLHDGGSWLTGAHLRRYDDRLGVATRREPRQTPFFTVGVAAGVVLDVHQMD